MSQNVVALLSVLALLSACSDDAAAGGSGGGPSGGDGTGGPANVGGAPTAGGGEGGSGGDPGPMKRVFVSSTTFEGDFGGLVGGDAECQALADGAELGGTWLAWLSETNGGDSPSTRFTQSTDPYVLVGGAQIAADWAALIDGSIDVPIDRDENGEQISPDILVVWTGTGSSATGLSPCCDDWTNVENGGAKGLTNATDSNWTFNTGQGCTTLSHLYCFEQ